MQSLHSTKQGHLNGQLNLRALRKRTRCLTSSVLGYLPPAKTLLKVLPVHAHLGTQNLIPLGNERGLVDHQQAEVLAVSVGGSFSIEQGVCIVQKSLLHYVHEVSFSVRMGPTRV